MEYKVGILKRKFIRKTKAYDKTNISNSIVTFKLFFVGE